MTKANPYNDIKLLFCVIITLLCIFGYKKNVKTKFNKKNKLNMARFALTLRYDDLQQHTGKHKCRF